MDVTDDWPTVRLDLDSRPETLTLVRGALGGVADQLALDPELLDDLKTAVSEACNNVVMHAYDDQPGPLGVRLYARPDAIEVVIRDEGNGIAVGPDDSAYVVGRKYDIFDSSTSRAFVAKISPSGRAPS